MAMMGARTDWNGRGIRSPSEKRFLRKSCVSGTYIHSLVHPSEYSSRKEYAP